VCIVVVPLPPRLGGWLRDLFRLVCQQDGDEVAKVSRMSSTACPEPSSHSTFSSSAAKHPMLGTCNATALGNGHFELFASLVLLELHLESGFGVLRKRS